MKICNIVAALALTSGPALAQDEITLLLDWRARPDKVQHDGSGRDRPRQGPAPHLVNASDPQKAARMGGPFKFNIWFHWVCKPQPAAKLKPRHREL